MRVLENHLHPKLLRLDADTVTEATLDAAFRAHPKRGFTCVIQENDIAAIEVLVAHGFVPVRRTVEGMWRPEFKAPQPDFEHGTLAQRPDLTKTWLAAHRQHYFATHRANPPADLSTHSWDEVFLGEDFQPEAAFYILDENGIAAFSSLRPAGEDWELAWFGTVPENHCRFEILNKGLVGLEAGFMAAHDIPSVRVEFDSTSPDAMWRLHEFSLSAPSANQTYHLIW